MIVEHTSSNPNAPLHIGNLRNVMIGAHLARLLAAVGYEVQQRFYVNDLGAQIGLTALAYTRCYKVRRTHSLTLTHSLTRSLTHSLSHSLTRTRRSSRR